ncbi:uncharacterized protein LOC144077034 isoform X2 [Stigmatopora argus]
MKTCPSDITWMIFIILTTGVELVLVDILKPPNGEDILDKNGQDNLEDNGDDILDISGQDNFKLNGEEMLQARGKNILENSGEDNMDINSENFLELRGEDNLEIGSEEISYIGGEDILDTSGDDMLEANGKNILEISGEDNMDIHAEIILDISREDILDISGEDNFEISVEDILDISGEDNLEIRGKDILDISGEVIMEISEEGNLDIIGEDFLDISRENFLELSEDNLEISSEDISYIGGEDILDTSGEDILETSGEDILETSGENILNFDEEDTVETTATAGTNLSKLMITLSRGGTGYYYPPYFSFRYDVLSHRPSSYSGWTTKAGVTMCLRYRFASSNLSPPHIAFTISPSSLTRLKLVSYDGNYYLKTQSWRRKLEMLELGGQGVKEGEWTKLCLVVSIDFVKLQTSCSSAVLRREFGWAGEPVIAVSGVDSHMTDLQMWDYASWAIAKKYTAHSGHIKGSVLKWSDIGYTLSGNVGLEEE